MDDLSQQISQILSDPAQMAQISALADSLGFTQAAAEAQEPASGQQASPDTEALGKLLPLLSQSAGREAQLFQAIRPYLSAENQRRADRAIRAAKLSRLAKVAMQQLGDGTLQGLL